MTSLCHFCWLATPSSGPTGVLDFLREDSAEPGWIVWQTLCRLPQQHRPQASSLPSCAAMRQATYSFQAETGRPSCLNGPGSWWGLRSSTISSSKPAGRSCAMKMWQVRSRSSICSRDLLPCRTRYPPSFSHPAWASRGKNISFRSGNSSIKTTKTPPKLQPHLHPNILPSPQPVSLPLLPPLGPQDDQKKHQEAWLPRGSDWTIWCQKNCKYHVCVCWWWCWTFTPLCLKRFYVTKWNVTYKCVCVCWTLTLHCLSLRHRTVFYIGILLIIVCVCVLVVVLNFYSVLS